MRQKSTLAECHNLQYSSCVDRGQRAARDTKMIRRRDEFSALLKQDATNKQGFQSTTLKWLSKGCTAVTAGESPFGGLERNREEEGEEPGDRRTSGAQFTKPKHFYFNITSQ